MRAQTATSRADLLKVFAATGERGLGEVARLLGYERQHQGEAIEKEPSTLQRSPEPPAIADPADTPLAPTPFWRLEQIHFTDPKPMEIEPETDVQPIGLKGIGRIAGTQPETPPSVSDARLWPALRRALASEVPSRDVDVDALLDRWTRGHSVRELPRLPMRAWAPRVQVLVDRSERLIPFWDDQDHALGMLRRRLGAAAIEEIRFYEGEQRPWRSQRQAVAELPSEEDVPLLALTDLGFLAGAWQQRAWRRTGHRLRRLGARAAAVVPCPANRWQAASARVWNAVDWSQPNRAPRIAARLTGEARLARAEALLARLAFAARIEPGLLRSVRQLMPAREADIGTEADAWSHPGVAGGFAAAADLDPDLRRRLQGRFANLDDETKVRVIAAMRAWRRGMPREIWLDEVLALDAGGQLPEGILSREEIEDARHLWRRMAETIDHSGADYSGSDGPSTPAVAAFSRRAQHGRHPASIWDDEELRPVLWRTWRAAWPDGEPELPAGIGPEVLGGSETPPRRWSVRQVGASLGFQGPASEEPAGSLLVALDSSNGEISTASASPTTAPHAAISRDLSIPLPGAPALTLRTDRSHATLRRLTRPSWANAMGRDHWGLWTTFKAEAVEQRMRWIPPGRFMMGSPESEAGRYEDEGPQHLKIIEHGFWLADTPCTQALWQAVMGENPSHFQFLEHPVEQVSWEDTQRFLERLNSHVDGLALRLPSEAEWEYACRAGTTAATYAGPLEIDSSGRSAQLEKLAWYSKNSDGKTQPVAQMPANPWRLYDMLGNVYEWCEDRWRSDYQSEPQGTRRVYRGGSWFTIARNVRAAYRFWIDPSLRWNNLGFRLARGQSALRPGAERRDSRAEPVSAGAERHGGGDERGTRRRSRRSRPAAATR